MDDPNARVYAATALSPLSIFIAFPIGAAAFGLARGVPTDIATCIDVAGLILVVAYPAMLLIGLPSYLVMRRFKMDALWTAALVGYLAATSIGILLMGHVYSLPPSSLYFWLNPFFLLGPVVGVVFWWIAKPQPEVQP